MASTCFINSSINWPFRKGLVLGFMDSTIQSNDAMLILAGSHVRPAVTGCQDHYSITIVATSHDNLSTNTTL